ncbi:retrotransposon protein, putative, ty1-copia subclass, partial [Tanacetum coccineum]
AGCKAMGNHDIKVGGWGGSGGINPWTFSIPNDCKLSMIRIASDGDCIHSIQFTYLNPKNRQINSPIYGTDYEGDKNDIVNLGIGYTLTGISGTFGQYDDLTVITSLSFHYHTNGLMQRSHTFLPSQPQTYHTVIMVKMVPYEAFPCPCGAEDVVLRESYKPKTRGKLYYACPRSKPRENTFGCKFFLWKEERVRLLVGSPRASMTPIDFPGSSSTPIYSIGSLTPPRYSLRASTPQTILRELQEMQSAQTASTCLIR